MLGSVCIILRALGIIIGVGSMYNIRGSRYNIGGSRYNIGCDNFIAKVLLILKNILCKIVLVKVIHGFGKRRQMMLLQNHLFFTNPWLNADGYQAPGNGCSTLVCLMSHIQIKTCIT